MGRTLPRCARCRVGNGHTVVTVSPHHNNVDIVTRVIANMQRPLLLVFDCDGVLAPLTDHADDSVLTAGVGDDLARLSEATDVTVAILSGRSLDGLAQFDFVDAIVVAGSYGGERRGATIQELTSNELSLLDALDAIAVDAADAAGPGAWVERKPTSVVIHVREADPDLGAQAIAEAWVRQATLDGHECHEGSNVLELMARPTDKGQGLTDLRAEFGPAGTVYFGDDVPDEDAFAVLGDGDVSVKVGDGSTAATHRIADAADVAQLLGNLVVTMGSDPELAASKQR
jgi:trehalose 6-phosphate phosphatase